MKKNRCTCSAAVLLLAFAGFSFSSFKDSMTPYVSYEQAREGDRIVQVAGALEKGSSAYVDTRGVPLLHPQGPEDAARPCGCATRA